MKKKKQGKEYKKDANALFFLIDLWSKSWFTFSLPVYNNWFIWCLLSIDSREISML